MNNPFGLRKNIAERSLNFPLLKGSFYHEVDQLREEFAETFLSTTIGGDLMRPKVGNNVDISITQLSQIRLALHLKILI